MDYIAYKNYSKYSADQHHYLNNGEYSRDLINEWSKEFKMTIDANVFVQFSVYNKDVLESFAKKLKIHLYLQKNITILSNFKGLLPILEIVKQKSYSKNDWCWMIYVLFSDPNLFQPFLKGLSEPVQKLWEKLIWTKKMNTEEVKSLIGINPILTTTQKTSWGERTTSEPLDEYKALSFSGSYNYHLGVNSYTFSLLTPVRMLQRPYVEAPEESLLKSIPQPQNCTILESENLAIQDLPRVLAYHSQGNIKTVASGRPNAATSSKMRKTLSLQEFYTTDKELDSLRSHLLAHWIVYVPMKQINVGTPSLEIIKILHEKLRKNNVSPFAASTTRLKGLHHIEQYFNVQNDWYFEVFQNVEAGQWYDVANLQLHMILNEIEYEPTTQSYASSYLMYKAIVNYNGVDYEENTHVSSEFYDAMVLDNYVKCFLFMLSALGAVDVAYTQPEDTSEFGETFHSDFEGLYAFRLNALGAYLLGKNKSYETPIKEDATNLVFDETELIILGKAEDKLTDTLLLNYVQKAGANRYIVTAQSFLKDCKNPKQIKDKIALFKQTVGVKKLPDNWEDFFKLLQERAENIKIASDSYEVFELNKEDKELIRLIAQDKDFQKIVIKAEGFKVLIYKTKMAAFRSKLKEYGYLLK